MPKRCTTVSRQVVLPDGTKVSVSQEPEAWWTQSNASGYLDPRTIAADLDNPRQYMSPARREELTTSIRSRGVRQQLVVTPRMHAPWARIASEDKHCFFVNVSGHRRQRGALDAHIAAVPVKVVIFGSEKEHRMEMSLLNKGQDDLTPLEEGYEIVRLKELGWKIAELMDAFGYKNEPQLYELIYLTRLHPDLKKLLDPELPKERRLGKNTAGHLGAVKEPTPEELREFFDDMEATITRQEAGVTATAPAKLSPDERRFAMQKMLFAVIKKLRMSSAQAVEFIRDHRLKLAASHGGYSRKAARYQPRRRKDLIETLAKQTTGSLVVGWPAGELQRIFGNDSREEVERYIGLLRSCADVFGKLIGELEMIRGTKKATRPEVLALITREKVKA